MRMSDRIGQQRIDLDESQTVVDGNGLKDVF